LLFYVPFLAVFGIIAFGGIFLAVARGLWVKLESPKGQPVTREQAPRLFALLDELRTALDCRPFHKVFIVGDMNAGVVQIPRLGIFGWHQNYLVIGLPLMQSLAPEELKAVLAHEFAHSSRGHGQFGNWLYRVRRTWAQIFEQMARQRTRFGDVLHKFINWFWPVFNGHIFVLARANEYEADACSVRLANADAAASALIRIRLDGALVSEKFWPDVFSLAKQNPEPPANVMMSLNQTLLAGPAADDAARWLRQAFLIETNNADTHPCLKDRLRAINRLPAGVEQGKFPAVPPVPPQNAADFFLGPHAKVAAQLMSNEWRKAIARQWTVRHEQTKKLADELAGLEKPSVKPPTAAEIWEKARKLVDLHGDQAALTTLEQVISLEPSHAAANFIIGRHHLQTDDPRGVAFIENALTSDPALTNDGCNLLYAHFNRTGQRDKLRPLENRVDEFQKITVLANQERAQISAANTFIGPELTERQMADLQKLFSSEPDIGIAAVTRKQVVHLPKSPCYVIGLKIKTPWWKPRSSSANQKLVRRVLEQAQLPGYRLVFVSEKKLIGLGTKILQTPGAFVYRRVEKN